MKRLISLWRSVEQSNKNLEFFIIVFVTILLSEWILNNVII